MPSASSRIYTGGVPLGLDRGARQQRGKRVRQIVQGVGCVHPETRGGGKFPVELAQEGPPAPVRRHQSSHTGICVLLTGQTGQMTEQVDHTDRFHEPHPPYIQLSSFDGADLQHLNYISVQIFLGVCTSECVLVNYAGGTRRGHFRYRRSRIIPPPAPTGTYRKA